MTDTTHCPSGFTLRLYSLEDLPPEEMAQVDGHLESCFDCAATLQSFLTKSEMVASSLPELRGELLERCEAHVETTPITKNLSSRAALIGGLAAAAAIALVVVWMGLGDDLSPNSPTEPEFQFRAASGISVEIIGKRGDAFFNVEDGTPMTGDDALRFFVSVQEPGWVSIFSIDAGGVLSEFYPQVPAVDDPSPLRLDATGRHTLPGSVVLDSTPGTERLLIVYSVNKFDRALVHGLIHASIKKGEKPKGLPKDVSVQIIRLDKVNSR